VFSEFIAQDVPRMNHNKKISIANFFIMIQQEQEGGGRQQEILHYFIF
jgi:hypothetical protein